MQPDSQVVAVGHVIQLAVAPVFLLTGVGGLLAVLTNRLARIIDRARFLEERLVLAAESQHPALHAELGQLVSGTRPGRSRPDELTLYKSVGVALEDDAAAGLALRGAEERELGTVVEL